MWYKSHYRVTLDSTNYLEPDLNKSNQKIELFKKPKLPIILSSVNKNNILIYTYSSLQKKCVHIK